MNLGNTNQCAKIVENIDHSINEINSQKNKFYKDKIILDAKLEEEKKDILEDLNNQNDSQNVFKVDD
jgi:hypothetical protein